MNLKLPHGVEIPWPADEEYHQVVFRIKDGEVHAFLDGEEVHTFPQREEHPMSDHTRKAIEHAESAGGTLARGKDQPDPVQAANHFAAAQVEATLSLAHRVARLAEVIQG